MEILLWRWSSAVQVSSAVIIAVFFLALSRSVARAELKPWVYAWLANLAAIAVSTIFWFFQPEPPVLQVVRFGYLFAKTAFVALLLIGAYGFVARRGWDRLGWMIFLAVALYAGVGAFAFTSIPWIGVAQASIIAIVLGTAAILLVRKPVPAVGWLCVGFSARALLAALETMGYADELHPEKLLPSDAVNLFLATHSSFDTGAEWLIALGCVLVVYSRIQQELTRANAGLIVAQESLRQLADRDPLTALANRRSLPEVLRAAASEGATILFFDLNDFKEINDHHGHQVGDDCLRVFGRALQGSFRPTDAVIRYAGDEFVVVARGCEPASAMARVDEVTKHLQRLAVGLPPLGFSVGFSYLEADGDSEAAFRAADEAMYEHKGRRSRRTRV